MLYHIPRLAVGVKKKVSVQMTLKMMSATKYFVKLFAFKNFLSVSELELHIVRVLKF
jgi:hypothetical protein